MGRGAVFGTSRKDKKGGVGEKERKAGRSGRRHAMSQCVSFFRREEKKKVRKRRCREAAMHREKKHEWCMQMQATPSSSNENVSDHHHHHISFRWFFLFLRKLFEPPASAQDVSFGILAIVPVVYFWLPVHKSQLTCVALPKAMPMPEVPKRALAAPSSLQRSKFTLAPGKR